MTSFANFPNNFAVHNYVETYLEKLNNHNDLAKWRVYEILNNAVNEAAEVLKMIEKYPSVQFADVKSFTSFLDSHMTNENFLKAFEKLNLDQKEMILQNILEFDDDELLSFVFTLNMSKTTGATFLDIDLENFQEFRNSFKITEDIHTDSLVYSFDSLDHYSKEFEEISENWWSNKTGWANLMFLLREIYGENQVLEAVSFYRERPEITSTIEILKLLQNWNELKNYPIVWALSMASDLQLNLD